MFECPLGFPLGTLASFPQFIDLRSMKCVYDQIML